MEIKKGTVLKNHKKVGSKFIPSFSQLGGLTEISYVNQILPEIIWMGLINDKLGYQKGVDLVARLTKNVFALKETKKFVNFALVSNFGLLSNDNKRKFKNKLQTENVLETLRDILAPLIILYKEFPLSFLGKSDSKLDKNDLIKKLKFSIERHIDKYETPGIVIQANVLYIRSINGGLFFTQNIKPPNLESIIQSPESEEAKRAGSFARTQAMQELMSLGQKLKFNWARSFWNRGYKIDKCIVKNE